MKRSSTLICILACLILSASCREETDGISASQSYGVYKVSLDSKAADNQTKAYTFEDIEVTGLSSEVKTETKSSVTLSDDRCVNEVVCFAFDHITGDILYYSENAGDLEGTPVVKYVEDCSSFDWALPLGVPIDIFAIANYGEFDAPSNKAELLDPSNADYVVAVSLGECNESGIPMSGTVENFLDNTGNATLVIPMKKVLAKYRIMFDKPDGYTITRIKFRNVNNYVHLFAGSCLDDYDMGENGDHDFSNDVERLNNGQYVDFYVPENLASTINSAVSAFDGMWYNVEEELGDKAGWVSGMYFYFEVDNEHYTDRRKWLLCLGQDCKTNFDVIRNCQKSILLRITEERIDSPYIQDPEITWQKSGRSFCFGETRKLAFSCLKCGNITKDDLVCTVDCDVAGEAYRIGDIEYDDAGTIGYVTVMCERYGGACEGDSFEVNIGLKNGRASSSIDFVISEPEVTDVCFEGELDLYGGDLIYLDDLYVRMNWSDSDCDYIPFGDCCEVIRVRDTPYQEFCLDRDRHNQITGYWIREEHTNAFECRCSYEGQTWDFVIPVRCHPLEIAGAQDQVAKVSEIGTVKYLDVVSNDGREMPHCRRLTVDNPSVVSGIISGEGDDGVTCQFTINGPGQTTVLFECWEEDGYGQRVGDIFKNVFTYYVGCDGQLSFTKNSGCYYLTYSGTDLSGLDGTIDIDLDIESKCWRRSTVDDFPPSLITRTDHYDYVQNIGRLTNGAQPVTYSTARVQPEAPAFISLNDINRIITQRFEDSDYDYFGDHVKDYGGWPQFYKTTRITITAVYSETSGGHCVSSASYTDTFSAPEFVNMIPGVNTYWLLQDEPIINSNLWK